MRIDWKVFWREFWWGWREIYEEIRCYFKGHSPVMFNGKPVGRLHCGRCFKILDWSDL